jgi:hypothetical protein
LLSYPRMSNSRLIGNCQWKHLIAMTMRPMTSRMTSCVASCVVWGAGGIAPCVPPAHCGK